MSVCAKWARMVIRRILNLYTGRLYDKPAFGSLLPFDGCVPALILGKGKVCVRLMFIDGLAVSLQTVCNNLTSKDIQENNMLI